MGLFRSTIERIRSGLNRTRSEFATELRSILRGKQLSDDLLDQLEQLLIRADVGIATARELRQDVEAAWQRSEIAAGDDAIEYLKELLRAYWPDEDRHLNLADEGPTVILVSGINGSGKTTSIAKIAKSLVDDGRSVMLAACDTFRAAAVDQLEVWSKRLGVEVVKGKQGGKPSAVAWDAIDAALARGTDVVIVDTAGRLHTQKHLMDELRKIREVIERKVPGAPHEVLLVLDATTGQNAINQARIFAETIDVTGIFLAKLDGTAKGGIVVAIREQLNITVKFIGVGETPDDVEPFDPDAFVEAMFEQ
ncbi:MAG: signal recognition particle-docking protein FtsY [Phycisphaeraceae bacterium]|nr:signal recognition particle-docking protein FtsY [Phycisphaeraceae bacterium]